MVTVVNDELLIVRLSGVFDTRALLELAQELNKIETASAYPKRFVYIGDNISAAIKSDDAMLYKS